MKVTRRRLVVIAVAIGALAVAGAGIANAVGVGSEEQVTGPEAEKAKTAALKAVGGGTVIEVERQDGDGAGIFEVEVQREDGSQVEIHLDGRYQPIGTAPDDDTGIGSDDDDDEGADADD